MKPQLTDDPINQTQIPRVRELLEKLGFKHESLKSNVFRLSLIEWSMNYEDASGNPGRGFITWESETDRRSLGVMALNYLETDAHKYWPSRRAPPREKLEFPKDKIEIAKLLQRLFWRQNEMAARNAARKPSSAPMSSRLRSTSRLPSKGSKEHLDSPVVTTPKTRSESKLLRQIALEEENDEDFESHEILTKIVTLKYKQSEGNRRHQLCGDPAPAAQMVSPTSGLLGPAAGSPSTSYSREANPVQIAHPPNASDDDLDKYQDDEEGVVGRIFRRKRGRSSEANTSRSTIISSKRNRTSGHSELGSDQSPTTADDKDSTGTPRSPAQAPKVPLTVALGTDESFISPATAGATAASPASTPAVSPAYSAPATNQGASQAPVSTPSTASTLTLAQAPAVAPSSMQDQVLLWRHTLDLGAPKDVLNQRTQEMEPDNSYHFQKHPAPSQLDSDPSTRAGNDQTVPTVEPEVVVLVLDRNGSRYTVKSMKNWQSGTLKDKKSTIFDDVSRRLSRDDLQRINFRLETSKKPNEMEALIERDDMGVFEAVIQMFNKRINKCKKAGEAKFTLWLELDLEQQEKPDTGAVEEDPESIRDYL